MQQLDAMPDLLRVDEVQEYLRISRSAAYILASELGIRIGRRVRVPKSALRSYLDQHLQN